MCYCPTPTLHLNLALTGDGAFLFSLKKTHSVWFISILNYGDTENVLINHLLLVIPMSYPCHYTNLCSHKPHKHAHTHTQTQTHTHTNTHTHTHTHHTHTHTHTHTHHRIKQAVVHTAKIRHVESHSVRLQKTEICWLMLIKYYYWQYPSWKTFGQNIFWHWHICIFIQYFMTALSA